MLISYPYGSNGQLCIYRAMEGTHKQSRKRRKDTVHSDGKCSDTFRLKVWKQLKCKREINGPIRKKLGIVITSVPPALTAVKQSMLVIKAAKCAVHAYYAELGTIKPIDFNGLRYTQLCTGLVC